MRGWITQLVPSAVPGLSFRHVKTPALEIVVSDRRRSMIHLLIRPYQSS